MNHAHETPCTQEAAIAALNSNHAEMATKLERINHTIHGNGDGIGMKTDLALVVQRTEGLVEAIKEMSEKDNRREDVGYTKKMLWVTILAVIASIVFSTITLIKGSRIKKDIENDVDFKLMFKENKDFSKAPTRSIHYSSPIVTKRDSLRDDSLMKKYRP